MAKPPRKIAFIVAATEHGTFIVNRFDEYHDKPDRGHGVGFEVLEQAAREPAEVDLVLNLLDLRRHYHGNGVVIVDCGANIGTHTIEFAKHMTGWGTVLAIEAQERLYYALAGNIAINNCFNARAIHAAVTSAPGAMKIPQPDYLSSGNFGALELKKRDNAEFIGQPIDYRGEKMTDVPAVSLDSLKLGRIDLVRIDIEGMELEALEGSAKCLAAQHPMLLIETSKTDMGRLRSWVENYGYSLFDSGRNCLAVHRSDKSIGHVNVVA